VKRCLTKRWAASELPRVDLIALDDVVARHLFFGVGDTGYVRRRVGSHPE
jgi:hypothetical protein